MPSGRIAGLHGFDDVDAIAKTIRPLMVHPTCFPYGMDRSPKGINKPLLLNGRFQELFRQTKQLSPSWNFKPTALSSAVFAASKAGAHLKG